MRLYTVVMLVVIIMQLEKTFAFYTKLVHHILNQYMKTQGRNVPIAAYLMKMNRITEPLCCRTHALLLAKMVIFQHKVFDFVFFYPAILL